MPIKMKKPFKKTVHKIKTATAKLTAVKSRMDMDLPIDENNYLHLEGCSVYTNLHTGQSIIKNCESITYRTKNIKPKPVNYHNPTVKFEDEQTEDENT